MTPRRRPSFGYARLVSGFLCCFVAILVPVAATHAKQQPSPNDSAIIFGTVWGPDDRPVYGVPVKIRRARDKKPRWEVRSNRLGEFEQFVPAGKETYVLWADTKGLETPDGRHLQAGEQVTVQIEGNERVNTGVHLK